MTKSNLSDWEIVQNVTGAWHAHGDGVNMEVVGGTLVKRNGLALSQGQRVHTRYLVGCLNGVFTYVLHHSHGVEVLMTTEELYP